MKWFDGELTGETISGIHFLLCLNRFQVVIKTLLICPFLFLLLSEEINISVSAAAGEDQNVNQIYFPLILQPDLFDRTGMPIWVDESTYLDFEVALFRKTFTIKQEANDAVLKIFADTRYELYVDGEWFGRGPARFSYSHREYDIYAVDHLSAGEHTIAVLVQWDPNYRR